MDPRDRYDDDQTNAPNPSGRGRRGSPARTQRYLTHISILIVVLGGVLLIMSRLPIATGQGQPPLPEATTLAGLNLAATLPPDQLFVLPTADDPGMLQRNIVSITDTVQTQDSAGTTGGRTRDLFLYTVRDGDTLFGIAAGFGLRPETVLWSNFKSLRDNPDFLKIDQELVIPPTDGLVVEVAPGDTIDALARQFKVAPEDIVNESINKLANVNAPLQVGQEIFVPQGQRETVAWEIPKLVEVKRNVVTGVRTYRTGTCGEVSIPALGSGNFIWPANRHYLSGYNFSAVHAGIDIAGRLGEPIYASDAGTVIYAGFSLSKAGTPVGYGQYIVLDHGNGTQTLYAHASQLYVTCGQQVSRGAVIAAVGSVGRSTGPHLHFEIRSGGGAINPFNVLPAP